MKTFNMADDLSGGFLDVPGTFHFHVDDACEVPLTHDGRPIQNVEFQLSLSVLAGTVAGQEDKTIDVTVFSPKSTAKDGGKFQIQKISKILIALGFADESQLGKPISYDISQAVGRHFVATLESRTYNEKTYLDLAGDKVYHVDSVAAKPFPKNEKMLATPAKWRRTAAPAAAAATNGQAAAPWESSL